MGRAVMTAQDEESQNQRTVLCQGLFDRRKVAQRFTHLDAVYRDHVVEQPVTSKGFACDRFRLGDLALVVGKDVFQAAAVNVKGLAQVFH